MLESIRLQRFKRFKENEIILKPFTVLMGENSSGKTSVLQALNLSLNMLSRTDFVQCDGQGVVKIRTKGVGLTQLPGLSLSDYRELYYQKIPRGGKERGVEGARIELRDTSENIYKLQITSLFGSYNVKCRSSKADLSNSPRIQEKQPLFISGFVGLQVSEERAYPVAIQERLRFGQASSIIRNLLLDMVETRPERYSQLQRRLQNDFSFHLGDISFDVNRDLHVHAQFSDVCDEKRLSLDFNSSGSGFMQVLQILAPIYSLCPDKASIVLLDEPDAHLHPNLQGTLATALREIQKEFGIQIIISTHSTSIIRAADPSEVVPVSYHSNLNQPLLKSEDVEQMISVRIDNYDLAKGILSGKIVFIEDENIQILSQADKILGTGCFAGPYTVPLIRGRGKDDKIPFQIGPLLKELTGQTIEVHVIRDGDGLPLVWRDRLREYAVSKKVVLHQLARFEIESYLLEPGVVHRALLNRNGPLLTPSIEEVTSKVIQILKSTISLAKYKYDDGLEDSMYKTALVLGDSKYRNFQECKSEAIAVRESYEEFQDVEQLLVAGMGKEGLKLLLGWVNGELKLVLGRTDLIDALEGDTSLNELKQIFIPLQSKQAKPSPERVDPVDQIEISDSPDEDLISEEAEEPPVLRRARQREMKYEVLRKGKKEVPPRNE